jgi:phosphoglycolate phosphatase
MSVDLVVGGNLIPSVDLVVFDKDGTLIDVHTYWANMVRFRADAVIARLGLGVEERNGIMDAMGVDVETGRIKPDGPVGLKKREIVLRAGVEYLIAKGHSDTTGLFEEIFQHIDDISIQRLDEIISPLNGLVSLIDRLHESGCQIAVATTDRSYRAAAVMEYLGLNNKMAFIAGADMVEKPKPDPEIIHLICQRLGVAPAKSVMVGDASSDVKAGLRAGCLASIAVASGLTSKSMLEELTPHVIPDISAIEVRLS